MPHCSEYRTMLAIDPGSVHCGMAAFSINKDGAWACYQAWERLPLDCEDYVARLLLEHIDTGRQVMDVLVVEQFNLYPDKALELTGSTMGTAEVIGVLKYLCHVGKTLCVMQPASIQAATKSVLRSRGIRSTAKAQKAGGHALSAELHGYYWLMQTERI